MKTEKKELLWEDKILVCKDCGKEFVFPAKITVTELSREISEETAQKLLNKRDMLSMTLNLMEEVEEKKVLSKQLYTVESAIVELSSGNTQEAYQFRGFTNDPSRCLKCRTMRKSISTPKLEKKR